MSLNTLDGIFDMAPRHLRSGWKVRKRLLPRRYLAADKSHSVSRTATAEALMYQVSR
jgi:hypothetical protein